MAQDPRGSVKLFEVFLPLPLREGLGGIKLRFNNLSDRALAQRRQTKVCRTQGDYFLLEGLDDEAKDLVTF